MKLYMSVDMEGISGLPGRYLCGFLASGIMNADGLS